MLERREVRRQGFTAAVGLAVTTRWPPTVRTTLLSVMEKFLGCGNFANSTPGGANFAPEQSKSSGL
ncbi:hypothetical protein ACFQZC_02610 [Streptacidiphilus monticola]